MEKVLYELQKLAQLKEELLFVYVIAPIIVSSIIFLSAGLPKILRQNKQKNNEPVKEQVNNIQEINLEKEASKDLIQLCKCYQPKYLMTLNEKHQYWNIRKWADTKKLIVFTKVRLLDLITPINKTNTKLLWKIQAKHLDFVICDNKMNVKCIVEIQDNSHHTADREERDLFVRTVLKSCGYKLIEAYNITNEQLDRTCGYYQNHELNNPTYSQ